MFPEGSFIMLVLKIIFGLIVTLPILVLAEYLFEQTVDDALVGTTKKKRVPFFKRFALRRKRRKERERMEQNAQVEQKQRSDDDFLREYTERDIDE